MPSAWSTSIEKSMRMVPLAPHPPSPSSQAMTVAESPATGADETSCRQIESAERVGIGDWEKALAAAVENTAAALAQRRSRLKCLGQQVIFPPRKGGPESRSL